MTEAKRGECCSSRSAHIFTARKAAADRCLRTQPQVRRPDVAEATGPLLDQPQHDKSLEASGIRLRLAMSKVEQLADFARAQQRGQTSNHVGAPCSPMAAYEDRHRAHCLDQCLRSGSVVISQPRQTDALFPGGITFVRKRLRG